MAIDHLLEQLLDRIRHDPDLRRQLAQLLFGRELAQLADQLAQLASLVPLPGRVDPAGLPAPR
jgi:hypothetical protein